MSNTSTLFTQHQAQILHRETRATPHGEELRWAVTKETFIHQPTGATVTRSLIRHPGICVIVPFLDEQTVLLLRQYRYAIEDELWELPAGTLAGHEENQRVIAIENPVECAARELIEEAGYKAGKLTPVTTCYAIPGSGDERMHFFFATELQKTVQSLDHGEIIAEVRGFTLIEINMMIQRGEIRDAKTLIGLFYALRQSPVQ